ncbi:MAG: hypothetical protein JXR96_15865 [Deltaproteobacteria bacterium]|nr:hypothetical protein [Deltaproteobacteria bacterium]
MTEPDMSPSAVTARLREIARLRAARLESHEVDMSPKAVTRRLKEISRLRDFCLKLARSCKTARPE